MKRQVCYVSGTRADFGLMERTLRGIAGHPRLALSICVTGMHLSALHGATVTDIEAAGLPIRARIALPALEGDSGAHMGKALGQALVGIIDALSARRPDVLLVLGDRGEMLAGALAALHLNIPIVHVHGGERSGTVDEPVRHAISKLAHLHCVSTEGARERLVRMGERPEHVFVTGAPGLDGIEALATFSRRDLCAEQKLDPARSLALVIFHPVVQEAESAGAQAQALLDAVFDLGMQAVCFTPNSDAGSSGVRAVLERHAGHDDVRVITHVGRAKFISWMAAADVMVGNSSAGIIEAASLGLPVVNVGSRQQGRERSANVVDVPNVRSRDVAAALQGIPHEPAHAKRHIHHNVYGDGRASERIVDLLANFAWTPAILNKCNAY
jgi:GDP/UDP-N,N'-diacetylbacillosamine 2-epimerase (hydrolysing)